MINYVKGNLLDFATKGNIIVHGCNMCGVMGSGVAKQIKENFPKCYAKYKTYVSDFMIGDVIWYSDDTGIVIANALTQEYYGRSGRYVSYDAVEKVMHNICSGDINIDRCIYMPKIGAGLGGGDWDIIEAIINLVSDKYGKTINIVEL